MKILTSERSILRELSLNIAQLCTARQELLWLHFSLSSTLAFLALGCLTSVTPVAQGSSAGRENAVMETVVREDICILITDVLLKPSETFRKF